MWFKQSRALSSYIRKSRFLTGTLHPFFVALCFLNQSVLAGEPFILEQLTVKKDNSFFGSFTDKKTYYALYNKNEIGKFTVTRSKGRLDDDIRNNPGASKGFYLQTQNNVQFYKRRIKTYDTNDNGYFYYKMKYGWLYSGKDVYENIYISTTFSCKDCNSYYHVTFYTKKGISYDFQKYDFFEFIIKHAWSEELR
jgi:hypothetical protein